MKPNSLQWRSLKTRLILLTLAIFLLGTWALQFYVSRMLREDIERLLGEQQFSTVSILAEDINAELNDRLRALEGVAGRVRPGLLGNPVTLQRFLERRPALLGMFNAGLAILDSKGTAIASLPVSVGRIGVNYMERDYIAAALKEGRSSISQPTIAKLLKTPVFGIAAPIRDEQGTVIGALAGLIDLSKPSFLDKIAQSNYGKTGGYVLISPKDRLIVTGTDKSRIMTAVPAPGINPLFDRYAQGFEGFGTTVDSRGLEVLSAAKQIPVAGWLLVARIPAAEAFAPIHQMQQRMLFAAIGLTLLAGGLIFWLLRRQLEPMIAAARALALISDTNQPLRPLPVVRHDEVGELIGGFNRVLETLGKREKALNESEERWTFAIEGSGDGVWDWNVPESTVFFTTRWKNMLGFAEDEIGSGLDEWSKRVHPDDLARAMADVQAHLDGTTPFYANEHRVSCKDGSWKWILDRGLVVNRDDAGKSLRMIGTHTDITERKQAEASLRESEARYRDLVETSHDLIWRCDANGCFTFLNKAWETTLGYAREEMLGRPFSEFEHPERAPQDLEEFGQHLAGGAVVGYETVHISKAGVDVVLLFNAIPVRDSESRVVGAQGTASDITERKRAEVALAEQLDELRRWQHAMLGREDRIITVKQEVNELLARSGQPPRYPSAQERNEK